MGTPKEYMYVLTLVFLLSTDSFQTTVQPVDDHPFGKECTKNDHCSCMNGGIPLCYGGYCSCIYTTSIVCKNIHCGQHCPSGIGICFLEKCHCYKFIEDKDATEKTGDKKPQPGTPTLLH